MGALVASIKNYSLNLRINRSIKFLALEA